MTQEQRNLLSAAFARLPGPYHVEVQGVDGVKSYVIMDSDGHEFARIDPAPEEVSGPAAAYRGTAHMLAASWDLHIAARRAVEALGSPPADENKIRQAFNFLINALGKANGHDEEMETLGRVYGDEELVDANLELGDDGELDIDEEFVSRRSVHVHDGYVPYFMLTPDGRRVYAITTKDGPRFFCGPIDLTGYIVINPLQEGCDWLSESDLASCSVG